MKNRERIRNNRFVGSAPEGSASGMGRRLGALVLTLALGAALLAGCGRGEQGKSPDGENSQSVRESASEGSAPAGEETGDGAQKENGEELLSGKHHVQIHIKDLGTISVELDADAAPVTVTNFVNLAKEGFYDGLTFHRIIKDFMMQGGDPKGDGTGGAPENIKGEFAANGVDNPLSHVRGAISMARASDPDSASSQFFIVHQDSLYLDGQYAAFGYVTEGMDIVDEICENTVGQDVNGMVPVENRPVIESIEVVD